MNTSNSDPRPKTKLEPGASATPDAQQSAQHGARPSHKPDAWPNAWEEEVLFDDGDQYFEALKKQIDAAKRSIRMEVYIFRMDQIGRSVLDSLSHAVGRGVRVQLLVDGFGSLNWNRHTIGTLKAVGIEARIYHPLPWQISRDNPHLARKLRPWSFLWRSLNRRNHRKTTLIDEQIALVGGINISSVHSKKIQGARAWRDTGVLVKGPEVRFLQDAFDDAWVRHLPIKGPIQNWMAHTGDPNPRRQLVPKWVRLNHRRSRRNFLSQELNHRILFAQERVWITTPYFVPSLGFLKALRQAALRGVSVQILLPGQNDILFMRWVARAYYRILTPVKIAIFEYLPATLHAKVVLVDNWATVGSTNQNTRSLIHDLEVDLVLCRQENIRRIAEQFKEDLLNSQAMSQTKNSLLVRIEAVLGRILLKLKHWL